MNANIDLSLLDPLNEQDTLILSSTDATDPFTDNFPAAADIDPLDPQLLSWPLNLDLNATHSHVTDSDASVAEGLAAVNREAAVHTAPVKKEVEAIELFDFTHPPPPPLALTASLAAPAMQPVAAPTPAPPPMARPRVSSPQAKRVCAKMEPATALSGEEAPVKPASPAPSSSGADSESQSANTHREPLSEADRQKEKLAQRKQRNKESARRYREKQVARRRQLENFTRTLAEQNRELEALHDRLLALACDRRLRTVAPPSGPPQRFAQHHPVAPPLQ